ncbi:HNH endonuclease signature motif containing protein [Shinella sp. M31]|uniref:HNH endonuclease signature motif containing protein n=1 Tax=Shinella sp. M31 TaxID=3368615 RepID=UPI003B9DF1BD
MPKNKYGLDREVGADVRRQLRQEAGFGCVKCGFAIGDYHHIDPLFVDAKKHDPSRMAFLCKQCHGKFHGGFLSAETIWEAKANPKARRQGFSLEEFDFPSHTMKVHLGSLLFVDCENIIMIEGDPVIAVRPPKEPGEPLLISAKLVDVDGIVRMWIDDNVWMANVDNWDVEATGGRIVFRDAPGRIRISVSNRDRELDFERLNINSSGHHLQFDKKSGFIMSTRWGEEFTLGQATFEKFRTGILLEGPILALGADAQPGAGAETSSASVNGNVRTQERMREIFQAKLHHYGMAYMAAPDFGGREPSTFTNAVVVVR